MSDSLAFECPLCRKTVQFPAEVIGQVVDCPECHKQFQPSVPLGRQVTGGTTSASVSQANDTNPSGEQTLRMLHPVAYRDQLFLTSLFGIALGLSLVFLVMGATTDDFLGIGGGPLVIIGVAMLISSILYFVYHWVKSITTTIKITSERTIVIRGIISKSTNEVQHDDIRNIRSERNLMERLFNYGDLALSSAGQSGMEIVVENVPDPQGVIDLIRKHQ